MSRPSRPLFAFCVLALSVGLAGCSTIYRPVYSPGTAHYKAPPPKAERSAADLLPPVPGPSTNTAVPTAAPASTPMAPAATAAPSMEGGEPMIPGMPQ